MNVRHLTGAAAVIVLGLAVAAPIPSHAMGDGNNGSSGTTVKKCKTGQVWNATTKKCVTAGSEVLPDEDLYQQGRALALAGEYDWAIQVLNTVANKSDPRVLNYLGYAHRKVGMIDAGIAYYQQALAIDPNYVLVREYLGEGYVAAGKVGLAREQLREIGQRCGANCEEYQELAEVIASVN